MPRIPSPKLNVAVHALGLRADFPDSEIQIGNGWLRWIGYLQPTPISVRYKVMVEYSGQPRPRVFVLKPALELPPGEHRLPHMFDDGAGGLCLHYNHEWDPRKSIASTIIPWTSEWLLHYEVWLVIGEWTGGGHEPSSPKRPEPHRRQRGDAGFPSESRVFSNIVEKG